MTNTSSTDGKNHPKQGSMQTSGENPYNFAITVHDGDGRIHGFPYGHLIHFTLQKNPDLERRPQAPQDCLLLLFASHSVTILGWRLIKVVSALRAGLLAQVRVLDARFLAQTPENAPVVTSITVNETKED